MSDLEIAYKFRLYPNEAQIAQIERTFGCCRFVYNYYLAHRIKVYEDSKQTFNFYACCKDLTVLKKSLSWLREVDSQALNTAIRDLDNAYQNFFRNVKKGIKPAGFPKFKKKHGHRQSYRTNGRIKVLTNTVQLPKLGEVSCRISRPVQGRILNATVSRTPSGKYFVSLCCRLEQELPQLPATGAVVGLELGIRHLAVSSDGVEYSNPKFRKRAEKRIAKAQRQLSRKTKGSNREEKARKKLAQLEEKVANQRKDALQKLTTELIRQYDVICLRDMKVRQMMKKNHRKLNKEVKDASWYELRRMLEYKAKWYGRKISIVDTYFPSSQLCSYCGFLWAGTKDLAVQEWECPNCGATHDRDRNAAANILKEGLRLLA